MIFKCGSTVCQWKSTHSISVTDLFCFCFAFFRYVRRHYILLLPLLFLLLLLVYDTAILEMHYVYCYIYAQVCRRGIRMVCEWLRVCVASMPCGSACVCCVRMRVPMYEIDWRYYSAGYRSYNVNIKIDAPRATTAGNNNNKSSRASGIACVSNNVLERMNEWTDKLTGRGEKSIHNSLSVKAQWSVASNWCEFYGENWFSELYWFQWICI